MNTIILRGKIHKDINYKLNYYKEFTDQLILCTWNTEDLNLIDDISLFDDILLLEIPNKPKNRLRVDPMLSLFYQSINIFESLKISKNDINIIIRCDEYYSNLHLLLNKYNTNKLLTNNIYFKAKDVCMLHPSDHLICGDRNNLIKCYEKILNIYNDKVDIYDFIAFEQVIARKFIEVFEKINEDNLEYLRKKYLSVVCVSELEDYKVSNNTTKHIYYNNFDPDGDDPYQLSIKSEDEI